MTKSELKLYVGDNGILITPIVIPGATSITKYKLIADEGKMLTKDGKHLYQRITVAADDVDNWKEVDGQE